MKNFAVSLITIIFLISAINVPVFAKTSPPSVEADGAILMDATTGKILYSKNINGAYPPASTTKVATALLALEKCQLTDVVTVGKNPPRVDGNRIGIMEGEQITVKDLLYGLVLMSGNDCAEALAEYISGSLDNFSSLMNEKAKSLGAQNTNFVNPSGLYDPSHKTSALDLALILKDAAKNEDFIKIAATLSYKTAATNKHPNGIDLYNENKMIQKNSEFYYTGAEIGKNGYTVDSLHSYAATVTRGNQRLILVLLHSANKNNGYYQHYIDAEKVFDYGFNNYELIQLYKKNDVVSTYKNNNMNVPLLAADDYFYVREKGSSDVPASTVADNDLSKISFNKGEVISSADITFKDEKLSSLNLISSIDHKIKPAKAKATSTPTKFSSSSSAKFLAFISGFIFLSLALFALGRIYIKARNKRSPKYYFD